MKTAIPIATILLLGAFPVLRAQQPNPPTTVQLPTFSFFSVETTVSVPDSGGGYLGRMARAASGSSQHGLLPRNRALGRECQAGGAFAKAFIHDFGEMDHDLADALSPGWSMRAAAAQRGEREKMSEVTARPADPLERQLADQQDDDLAQQSVAQIRAQRQAQKAAAKALDNSEVQILLERGEAALAEGKPAVAKVFFQSALNKAGTHEREMIARRLQEVQLALAARREPRK